MAWELELKIGEVQAWDGGLGKLSKSERSSSLSGSLIVSGVNSEKETFFFVCRDRGWWMVDDRLWVTESESEAKEVGESRVEDAVEELGDSDSWEKIEEEEERMEELVELCFEEYGSGVNMAYCM